MKSHQRQVVQHMVYFLNSSCFGFSWSLQTKTTKNIVNRIFPITHDTLIQPVASLIQNISHFSQYKIKPCSPLQVSMMSLPKFFTSSPTCHPNTFSLSLITCSAMATAFQVLSLVTRPHGSLSFPTCQLSFQEFIALHAFKMPRSLIILIKTVLNFVANYFPIHCYTISIFSLYFHVHILCILYKNFINLEIIYINH